MKKLILVAVLLAAVAVGSAFAANNGWALGAAFYLGWTQSAMPTGAALCVKFPGVPLMFGFSAAFGPYWTDFGITLDWWAFQTHLVGPVELYLGPGAFFIIMSDPYNVNFDGGLRIPVGFQIFIVKAFEIFLEPALAIHVMPVLPTFGFMASIGLRFWF